MNPWRRHLAMLRRAVVPMIVLTAFLAACQTQTGQSNTIGEDENRVLAERWFEEFDAELSLAVLDRWLTSDFVSHEVGEGEPIELAAYREGIAPFFEGFFGIRHEIRESVSEGDRIALLVDITLEHTGNFAGIEATGRTVHVSEMLILRFENGKIAEEWILFDSANFLQQLQG